MPQQHRRGVVQIKEADFRQPDLFEKFLEHFQHVAVIQRRTGYRGKDLLVFLPPISHCRLWLRKDISLPLLPPDLALDRAAIAVALTVLHPAYAGMSQCYRYSSC